LIWVNLKLISSFLSLFLGTADCLTNDDCPLDKACRNQKCVNPCLGTQCGSRAECRVNYHQSYCVCPPGLQGNPIVSCKEVGCTEDADCAPDKRCNFDNGQCVKVCTGYNDCAPQADCYASNHVKDCRCRPPTQGDGFSSCVTSKLFIIISPLNVFAQYSRPPLSQSLRWSSQNVKWIKTVHTPEDAFKKGVKIFALSLTIPVRAI